MEALGAQCDAIGVVAAVHPLVAQAVDRLQANQVPVFALISQLSAAGQVNYVGLDNWKVGRTAAWAFEHICKSPGKLAILVGNHRYRCQETNESGFRSYFREGDCAGIDGEAPCRAFRLGWPLHCRRRHQRSAIGYPLERKGRSDRGGWV
jgi:ABC-type sugar transport system substrate-binding protein